HFVNSASLVAVGLGVEAPLACYESLVPNHKFGQHPGPAAAPPRARTGASVPKAAAKRLPLDSECTNSYPRPAPPAVSAFTSSSLRWPALAPLSRPTRRAPNPA